MQEILREEKFASAAIRGVRVAADKYTRAFAWSARAAQGKVALVRGPWNEVFLDEVCRFPTPNTTTRPTPSAPPST